MDALKSNRAGNGYGFTGTPASAGRSAPAQVEGEPLPLDRVTLNPQAPLTIDARGAHIEEDMKMLRAACGAQRGMQGNNALRNPVMDLFSQTGKHLDESCTSANVAYAQYRAALAHQDAASAIRARDAFYQAVPETATRVADYRDAKARVGDNLATVAEIGAGAVIGVATAGAGLVVAAGAGALVTGATRVAVKGSVQGSDYEGTQAGRDLITGAVDGGAAVLGGRAASAAFGGASTLHMVGRGAVSGGSIGTAAGATRTALDEQTWEDGAATGMARVARSGVRNGMAGAATGAVVGPAVEWGQRGIRAGWQALRNTAETPLTVSTDPQTVHAGGVSRPPASSPEDELLPGWTGGTEKAADGGPDWNTMAKDGKVLRRYRTTTSAHEVQWEVDGVTRTRRDYERDGLLWMDIDNGKQISHTADSAAMLARARQDGTRTLTVKSPGGAVNVVVNGADPSKFEEIRAAVEAMPPSARARLKTISVLSDIGSTQEHGGSRGTILGLATNRGDILLRRNGSMSVAQVLDHEVGHNVDIDPFTGFGQHSSGPFWGDGRSVSNYGRTNRLEDFAETHRVVLSDWQRYQHMDAAAWAQESQVAKKLTIARIHNAQTPTTAEIRKAMTERSASPR